MRAGIVANTGAAPDRDLAALAKQLANISYCSINSSTFLVSEGEIIMII